MFLFCFISHQRWVFWKRVGGPSQISSARATACYVIGKQTVADWLPPYCPSATRKISGPGPSNKRLEATTLCVFVCSCICVAVTAQWYKCLGAPAGSLHHTGAEREKTLSLFKTYITLEQTGPESHSPYSPPTNQMAAAQFLHQMICF